MENCRYTPSKEGGAKCVSKNQCLSGACMDSACKCSVDTVDPVACVDDLFCNPQSETCFDPRKKFGGDPCQKHSQCRSEECATSIDSPVCWCTKDNGTGNRIGNFCRDGQDCDGKWTCFERPSERPSTSPSKYPRSTPTPAPTPKPTDPKTYYQFQDMATKLCLSTSRLIVKHPAYPGRYPVKYPDVYLTTCNKSDGTQQWEISYSHISNRKNKECLAAKAGQVHTEKCSDSGSQKWNIYAIYPPPVDLTYKPVDLTYKPVDPTYKYINLYGTKTCLSAPEGPLTMEDCSEQSTARWNVKEV